MPRRPPRPEVAASPSVHVMGDHVLFHNASTAKRFPFLASVPQAELAVMFHTAPVDREAEKRAELQYCEPYVDQRITFREAARSGLAPFVPCNPIQAKETILGTKESIYIGTYNDADCANKERLATSEAKVIVDAPPSYGNFCALSAGERLHNRYFLNAIDTEIAAHVRSMTANRIKVNRELLETDGYGRSRATFKSSSSTSNYNRSIGTAPSSSSRKQQHLPEIKSPKQQQTLAAAGPRPMSSSNPPGPQGRLA